MEKSARALSEKVHSDSGHSLWPLHSGAEARNSPFVLSLHSAGHSPRMQPMHPGAAPMGRSNNWSGPPAPGPGPGGCPPFMRGGRPQEMQMPPIRPNRGFSDQPGEVSCPRHR
eukprot:scaffold234595_cov30-Tisochrysis_lutea.AAC.2